MQYLSKANTVEDSPGGLCRQWLWRPKSTWIRKAVFQLHLWSGILLGFYAVVVCASGSAIVFRNDLYDWLESGGKAVSYKGTLYHWLSWLGKLHGSLLMEGTGMTANAVGGFLIAALCLTGMIVWWPGLGSWRRALTIGCKRRLEAVRLRPAWRCGLLDFRRTADVGTDRRIFRVSAAFPRCNYSLYADRRSCSASARGCESVKRHA